MAHYLQHCFPDMLTSINRALETIPDPAFVAGRSPAMHELNKAVEELARTDISVLFHGESGTGKEVYANLLHRLSASGDRVLVKLGCTVICADDLRAFTRRVDDSEVLLLDNVDELDSECQRLLLSVLQERENADGRKNCRITATSTRDLDREATAGRFRRELYYRLASVNLRLPALRERKEDIPEFLSCFLESFAAKMGRRVPIVGEEEMGILQGYDWPGNIRELENLAKRIAALGTWGPTLAEIRLSGAHAMRPLRLGRSSLKAVARAASRMAERELILKALERTHWNRKQAAKELQISYKALLYKIKQIEVPGTELQDEGEEG
jgi:two-component system response regulator AtoC